MLELTTGPVAAGGGCVARAPDGRVVFVRHSLPGERVRAVVRDEASSYLRADAVEILEPAPGRVPPPCPHAGPGRCGGCDWQHVAIEVQRSWKAGLIAEQLRRLAGVDRGVVVETLPAVPGVAEGLGWRTRVRFAVDPDGRVGFRRHRSHEVEVIDRCLIASAGVESLGVEGRLWPDVDEVDVFADPDGGQTIVRVSGTDFETLEDEREVDGDAGGEGGDDSRVPGKAGRRRPAARRGRPDHRARIDLNVLDRHFSISPGVFWQVHPSAAHVLGQAVLEGLEPKAGERAADLYAGAGLFTSLLAATVGPTGSVLAVERDRRACSDCRRNVSDQQWVTVFCGGVSAGLVESRLKQRDLIVLDPAREGAGKAVSAALTRLDPAPRRVAYVACDPASFARDLRVFLDAGWSIVTLRAFDLFPMTEHVEVVACLEPPGRTQPGRRQPGRRQAGVTQTGRTQPG